ncbi:MAG TPA: SRPBCC family protein [Solirubrobacteraceae bacterium]|nr:SRPBCC family protein [Solirubrobacteraceae bacterium]
MPPVSRTSTATPEQVFRVLSAPPTYAYWVVGSRSVESHDPAWPAPGTRFEHTQGVRPALIHDETESVASDPPHRLELIAKARPVLVARVVVIAQPSGTGTRMAMEEQALEGLAAPLLRTPPGKLLTQLRNRVSLRRLSRLAEAVAAMPQEL